MNKIIFAGPSRHGGGAKGYHNAKKIKGYRHNDRKPLKNCPYTTNSCRSLNCPKHPSLA